MGKEEMLKVLSEITAISTPELKVQLGIPLQICNATTIEEARFAYYNSPLKSEGQAAAILKWIDLCTLEQIGDVIVWGVFEPIAQQKREDLALQKALKAVTIDEAKIAYIHAPPGGLAQSTALRRWNGFSLNQALNACTLKEAMNAYLYAHDKSKAREFAFEKWILFCSTTEEITKAYYLTPKDSAIEKVVVQKLEKLFTEKIIAASTIEEVEVLCRHIPEDTGVRKIALKKREEFLLKQVNEAGSVEQAEIVYRQAAKFGEASTAALKKIFDLLVTYENLHEANKNKGGVS